MTLSYHTDAVVGEVAVHLRHIDLLHVAGDTILRRNRAGRAGMIGGRAPLQQRFDNHVRIGVCYIWTGCVHESGFGVIRTGHRTIYVHRYAWERAYGAIPPGGRIKQRCANKLCVRPDHLELG